MMFMQAETLALFATTPHHDIILHSGLSLYEATRILLLLQLCHTHNHNTMLCVITSS